MTTRSGGGPDSMPSPGRLWFGFLAGPVAWALHLNASYVAVPYLCGGPLTGLIVAISLASLGLAALGGLLSLASWRMAGKPEHTRGGGIEGRTSLLSIGGMATGLFFFFVIAVQSTPALFLEGTTGFFAAPCAEVQP